MNTSLRTQIARALWHAHPARPGPELAALETSQWWSREQLEMLQVERLRGLMQRAMAVPFHRDRFRAAGVGPGDVRTIADLTRVPILERDDLVRAGLEATRTPGIWGMRARTSGSLGQRLDLIWPLEEMRWRDAGEARAHAWLGSHTGERRLEVRCRPVGVAQLISAALLNAEAIHAPTVADPRVVERLVQSASRRPPTLIWGVSNALYTVARALIDRGRHAPTRACWSGGNHLHPHYRRALAEAFQCPVYERYATMENGVVAHECVEAGNLHVPAEGIIAEIVRADGTPAAPGEIGDILVTSLRNPAMSLIRYRVGDQAVAPPAGVCACGRGLPLFGRVVGRSHDVLSAADGQRITARDVISAIDPVIGDVVDIQVIGEADGTMRAEVMQPATPGAADDRTRVGRALGDLLGTDPVAVARVDQIALTPGGKLRTIVRHAPASG